MSCRNLIPQVPSRTRNRSLSNFYSPSSEGISIPDTHASIEINRWIEAEERISEIMQRVRERSGCKPEYDSWLHALNERKELLRAAWYTRDDMKRRSYWAYREAEVRYAQVKKEAVEVELQAAKHRKEAKREAERYWLEVCRLAASVSIDDADVQRVQAANESLESAEQSDDDRLETLRQNLWTLLVEPARQRAQEARERSIVMVGLAEEAARLADEAAEVVSEVVANLQTAAQAAAPAQRIVPFDLPGDWGDLND